MANRQPSPPALYIYIIDIDYENFSTENLNYIINNSLSYSVNYAKANLNLFIALRSFEIRDINNYSLIDLRVLSRELKIVK